MLVAMSSPSDGVGDFPATFNGRSRDQPANARVGSSTGLLTTGKCGGGKRDEQTIGGRRLWVARALVADVSYSKTFAVGWALSAEFSSSSRLYNAALAIPNSIGTASHQPVAVKIDITGK